MVSTTSTGEKRRTSKGISGSRNARERRTTATYPTPKTRKTARVRFAIPPGASWEAGQPRHITAAIPAGIKMSTSSTGTV